MAMFPVQGFVDGDFVIVLALVDDTDPMPVVAEKIAHHSVGKRVAAQDRPMRVKLRGELVADEATLSSIGAAPLDVLEVVYA
jgi:toluene monooxygenase system protein B